MNVFCSRTSDDAMIQREHLAAQVVQQVPIGVLCVAIDGSILAANPAFCHLVGYTESELRRMDNCQLSAPQDYAAELHLIRELVEEGLTPQVFTKRFVRRDGTVLWTEVKLSMVQQTFAEDGYLLAFVSDVSDRHASEQDMAQQRERESLLNEIAAQLRTSTTPKAMLDLAVMRLGQTLNADRVVAYQFNADFSGQCLAEQVNPMYPAMQNLAFPAACIPPPYLDAYRRGRLWTADDVYHANLSDCHIEMLERVKVRSMIVVAIVSMDEALEPHKRTLWGLLAVHQCRVPRQWTTEEQQLVQAVANQVSIALEQIHLLDELRHQAEDLETRVNQRTRSLEQALHFEKLVHQLTDKLRSELDEDQMLKSAVLGLAQTLEADGCIACLFDPTDESLEIRYEFFQPNVTPKQTLIGQSFPLSDWCQGCREHFFSHRTYQCQMSVRETFFARYLDAGLRNFHLCLDPSGTTADACQITKVLSPIWDDKGVIGVMVLIQLHPRQFTKAEISLVEQVASQCAIALRQSRLYLQEHAQRLSAEYFREFLQTSNDVFVEFDTELRYRSINPAGAQLLGRSPAAIIGHTNAELLGHGVRSMNEALMQTLVQREKVIVNQELELPDGNRVFESIFAPITDPSGNVERVIGVCRDITELKRQWQLLEFQNQQLEENNRLKEEFVATTSHELRTPLTAILGFSKVLMQGTFGMLNQKQQDYLQRINHSGQHLLELINDILDLSRLEARRLELEPEAIYLPDLCADIMALVQERATQQQVTLEQVIDPSLDWVVVDPRRLRQMLLNLVNNAVKFTSQGQVGLEVSRGLRPLTLKAPTPEYDTPEVLRFRVWDTGVGIAQADQQRLFQPFAQLDSSVSRKHEGTGLGLVITRKLAELHGGAVTLRSELGRGSEFTILLPLMVIPPAPAATTASPAPEK